MIWKTEAPSKVACFGWIAAHEAGPTQDKIVKQDLAYVVGAIFVRKMGRQ